MSAVEADKTRSFAFIGHGGDGKTTLADCVLLHAGVTTRLGSVDEGSSYMNFLPEEQQRRLSISTSICSFEKDQLSFNLLDTPGDSNFAGEPPGALMAVDHVVLVLSAREGIKLGAEKGYQAARGQGLSVSAVANKMDAEGADFDAVARQLEEAFGVRVVKLHLPVGSGDDYDGYVDLLNGKRYKFGRDGSAEAEILDIPAELSDAFEAAHLEMVEAIAEADDTVLEKYLEDGELTEEEITATLRSGTHAGTLLPLLSASASHAIGGGGLLRAASSLFPSPSDATPRQAKLGEQEIEAAARSDGPLVAYVFKSVADRYAGTLSLVRVYSGTLHTDMTLQNARTRTKERISKILSLSGEATRDIKEVGPGGIAAIPKLRDTKTGDSLGDERNPATVEGLTAPHGVISFAVEAANKGEEDKVFESLNRLVEEDPSLQIARDQRTNESLLTGLGQLHIEVTLDKLRRLFKVDISLKPPKVPYMETIRKRVDNVEGKLKKQTGGRGQFGQCILTVEPGERGSGVDFLDKIVGGAIPRGFIPAVEKGVREACQRGILAGFPVTDIKIHCVDGKHHSVDSSEQAFKTAGSMGVRAAVMAGSPTLLEPIMRMEVSVSSDFVGDVMGNLNSRRGKVGGVDARGHVETISAQVPMSEVLSYASDLTSITGGQGSFTMEFSHYEDVPKEIQEKLIAEAAAAKDED
jgi:elongation factor G